MKNRLNEGECTFEVRNLPVGSRGLIDTAV